MVSLSSNIPVSCTTSQSPGFGDEEEELQLDDVARGVTSSSLKSRGTDVIADETVMTEPEVAPLVVPAALFQPLPYHPMHIFVSTICIYTYFENVFHRVDAICV